MRDQSNLQQRQLYLQNYNLQQCILKALQELVVTSASAGLSTEATQLSILNALSTSQDFEILLVRDTGNSDLVVKQVTSYDANTPGTPVITYETVAGAAYTPIGALEYLDPSSVMNLVLTELQTLNLVDFSTETTLAEVRDNTSDALGGQGTEYIFGTGVVSGKVYKYLVVNVDCTFTTLTDSAAVNLLTDLGISGTVTKGMIIRPKSGKTIAAVTLATGSVVGVL